MKSIAEVIGRGIAFVPGLVVWGMLLAIQPLSLIGADLLGVYFFPTEWEVGGTKIDVGDVAIGGLLVLMIFGGVYRSPKNIPFLWAWVLLGVLRSLSYLNAPLSQDYLSDPLAVTYQVYRYGWKPILFYPIVFLLLKDRKQIQIIFGLAIASACLFGLQGMFEGINGKEAKGPFSSKNAFGGALLLPLVFSFGGMITAKDWIRRGLYGGAFLLLVRILLLSASRGALVGMVIGLGVYGCGMLFTAEGRRWIARLALAGVLGAGLLVAVKPNILESPAIAHMMTASDGSEDQNLKWRVELRWPHFINRLQKRPWLGFGTDVDLKLGTWGNTPHNGYLSLAVTFGIPAALIYLLFIGYGAITSMRLFFGGRDPTDRSFGLVALAGIAAISVHNIIDAILLIGYTANVWWMIVATTALVLYRERGFADEPAAVDSDAAESDPAWAGRAPAGSHA